MKIIFVHHVYQQVVEQIYPRQESLESPLADSNEKSLIKSIQDEILRKI